MSLLGFLKQSDEIVQVSKLAGYGPGAALLKAVNGERDRVRRENEEHPRMDDGDITRDFRFKAGMIFAFGKILELPGEAQEMIDRLESNNKEAKR
ncbi:MAG: hypothetical protein WC551_12820 [Patescibacteria group bacterium]|jgi:hypothetical protein